MPDTVSFRCNNCGHRFTADVLNDAEKRAARDEGRPASRLHCPECHRTDVRRGWE